MFEVMATIKIKNFVDKNFYEIECLSSSKILCGIDEVGRGCSAGPVVAASVILTNINVPDFITDSKLMSKKNKKLAYEWIIKNSIYSVGIVNNRLIDKFNILNCTKLAMQKSFYGLLSQVNKIDLIVVDSVCLELKNHEVIAFDYGELYSSSIAAASIVAKITRDNIMERSCLMMPCYVFSSHKGYVTKLHREKISLFGHSVFHRVSYL